ncbi:PAS domain-containing sensor histidine kinase [Pseudoduganella aquatica]|uniref:histidine kinase n=1 Tax=Pseudoduganella aquatica TaxID=2660641 RepID=A0A7X4HEG8_9BURK|nr:ATP-binding protein [Pseudoduganella aquatica]MYN09278.1 PAS domain-containing protein [Pseudoduganella aquatica]
MGTLKYRTGCAARLHARGEISIALLVSVAVTAVVTLVLAAFAVYFYQSEKAQRWTQLRAELAASAGEMADAAALPVWNYDHAQLVTIMKSGLSNRGLHASMVAPVGVPPYILVRGADGLLHSETQPPQDPELLQERRDVRAQGQIVASITLYASPAALLAELRSRSYAIAGMILALDLALVAGLYLVLWHMMLKPVQAIGRYAADVKAGLNPAAPAPRAWLFGELKVLLASLREMIALLDSRYRAMHASEQRLQIATRAAAIGIWDWDIQSGAVEWDDQMYRLFGVERAQVESPMQLWMDMLHPEDKERIGAALQRTLDSDDQFDREFRLVWPDGTVRHIQADSMLFRDAEGRPQRMVGVNYDISAHKAAQEELRRHRHHLEELVVERTRALSVAVAQAQAASQAKSVFLANMSHELRTPLNAVIGFSRLMAGSPSMQAEEKRNLGIIHRSGQHLLTLINDILELSKIEAGRIALQSEPVLLSEMLQEVMDMVSMRAGPEVALRLDSQQLPLRAQLDGTKLRQVLLNLMSNAVKFTRAGRITLQARASWIDADGGSGVDGGGYGHWLLAFAVSDTGPGIAPQDHERIFEPFVQAAQDGAAEGTGLGLPISREFVQLMGGSLTVQSALGEGAEFRFAVPAGLAQGGAAGSDSQGYDGDCAGSAELQSIDGAAAPPTAADLAALPGDTAGALRDAVLQLNLARAAQLLAELPPASAGTVAAIEAMLARHQYPELCAMLAPALAE